MFFTFKDVNMDSVVLETLGPGDGINTLDAGEYDSRYL